MVLIYYILKIILIISILTVKGNLNNSDLNRSNSKNDHRNILIRFRDDAEILQV
jgi:hypothetical protein